MLLSTLYDLKSLISILIVGRFSSSAGAFCPLVLEADEWVHQKHYTSVCFAIENCEGDENDVDCELNQAIICHNLTQ